MVKIYIEDHKDFQDKYLATVKHKLTARIERLLTAISHLEGGKIDTNDPKHEGVDYYTRHLTKIIDRTQYGGQYDYTKKKYTGTVNNFISTSTGLSGFNFFNIKDLLIDLLDDNGDWLERLLVCAPSKLIKAERILMRLYKLNNGSDFKVLKLVFSTEQETFWDLIKSFYRDHLPLHACPYCNRQLVIPIASATAPPLDHFFDQSRHPLLCFCLYNLVPSDTDCNSTNKGTHEFKDDYHLNPYQEGFGKDVRFSAIISPPDSVLGVDIVMSQNISPKKAKRVLGDVAQYDFNHKHGNMNVFKLKTLYGVPYYQNKAAKAIAKFKNMNNAKSSIRKFLHLIPLNQERAENAYIRWYVDKLDTPFYEREFQNEVLSKMNRDLHDEYHLKINNPVNFYVNKLIDLNEES